MTAEIPDDAFIEVLPWPKTFSGGMGRILNGLENAEIRTVGQLRQRSRAQLLRIPNFGKKSVAVIFEVLAAVNKSGSICPACGLPLQRDDRDFGDLWVP